MTHYLLKFNRDWADEFDCDGFTVVTEEHYKALEEVFNSEEIANEYMSFGFGTNEGWENEFTYSEFWDDLVKTKIGEDAAKVITDNFSLPYGIFPGFEYIFEDFSGVEVVESYYENYDFDAV